MPMVVNAILVAGHGRNPEGNNLSYLVESLSKDFLFAFELGKILYPFGPVLGPGGNYSFKILLQASRLGTDRDGRSYTITVRASDNAGNSGSKTRVVTVPRDQGH